MPSWEKEYGNVSSTCATCNHTIQTMRRYEKPRCFGHKDGRFLAHLIGSAAKPGVVDRAAMPEQARHVETRGVLLLLLLLLPAVMLRLVVARHNRLLRLLLGQHLDHSCTQTQIINSSNKSDTQPRFHCLKKKKQRKNGCFDYGQTLVGSFKRLQKVIRK